MLMQDEEGEVAKHLMADSRPSVSRQPREQAEALASRGGATTFEIRALSHVTYLSFTHFPRTFLLFRVITRHVSSR